MLEIKCEIPPDNLIRTIVRMSKPVEIREKSVVNLATLLDVEKRTKSVEKMALKFNYARWEIIQGLFFLFLVNQNRVSGSIQPTLHIAHEDIIVSSD